MLGYGIAAALILLIASFAYRPFRKLRAADYRHMFSRRDAVTLAGVVGFVVLAEATVPSTQLTGREVPQVRTPPQHMQDIAWSGADLSYAQVADMAPWLWPLGRMTRDELIARIEADLVLARAREAQQAQELARTAAPQMPDYLARLRLKPAYYASNVMVEGLSLALAQVDTRFTSDMIEAAQADFFVSSRIEEVLNTRSQRWDAQYDAVNAQISEMRAADGDAAMDNPAYLAALETRSGLTDALMVPDRTSIQFVAPSAVPKLPRSRDAFPAFAAVLPLGETRVQAMPTGTLTAPEAAPAPFAGVGQALRDAATGYRRAPARHEAEQRCGVIIVDTATGPALNQICEIALPLAIDYDITGADCTLAPGATGAAADLALPGTRVSDNGCKESWIFPHLAITFYPDSFTVHAPLPVGPDGTAYPFPAPLSRWFVTWEGVEKPLDPVARYPWDGTADVPGTLALRHDVQAQVISARRWVEFRGTPTEQAMTRAILQGIVRADTPTLPVQLSELSLEGLPPLADVFATPGRRNGAAPSDAGPSAALLGLAERQSMLNTIAGDVTAQLRSTGQAPSLFDPTLCSTMPVQIMYGKSAQNAAQIRAMRDAMGPPTCETLAAAGQILNSAQRAFSSGSWMWMLERQSFIRLPE